MAFARIETSILNHPKFLPLCSGEHGLAALGLWTLGLAYSMDQLSDGRVPRSFLLTRVRQNTLNSSAERLVSVGLWHDEGDHYLIHDYAQWNPSSEQIKSDRLAARERMRKHRGGPERSGEQAATFRRTQSPVRQQDVEVDKTKIETPRTGLSRSGEQKLEPWPPHPPILDRKLAAFAEGYRDSLATCPDPGAFRAEVVRAAPTWPDRHLPPKSSLLWFRHGDWYPDDA